MTYEVTPIENLDPITQAVANKAQGFREQNAILAGKIETLGGAVDVGPARLEHLMGQLVGLGILTEHAMWEINLDWERNLRPQLKNIHDKLAALAAEQAAAVRAEAARPKLIVPGR